MHLEETVNIFRLRKCFHGNLTILHNTGRPSLLQERGRVVTKALAEACTGTNVMFLNKIDLYLIALLYSSGRQSTTNKQTVSPVGYPRRAYFSYPTYYAIGERVHGSLDEPILKSGSRSSKR